MNICTICNGPWIDSHLVRWVRYVRKTMGPVKLCLFYVGDGYDRQDMGKHPVVGEFEKVVHIPEDNRPVYNRARMSACPEFGLDEVLYYDADVDILKDLSPYPKMPEGVTLGCCRSQHTHGDWIKVCDEMGWQNLDEMNNGFLWIKGDWGPKYDEAVKFVGEKFKDVNPRISGTIAFNVMLRQNMGEWMEWPYEYDVVWSDVEWIREARSVHYCNSRGQQKRVDLENLYRSVQ